MNPTDPPPDDDFRPPDDAEWDELPLSSGEPEVLQVLPVAPLEESIPEVIAAPLTFGRRPPHFGFGIGIALLWCLGFLAFSQVLPAFIGILWIVIAGKSTGADDLARAFAQDGMQVTIVASHICGIAFSILILRWLTGSGWTRRIAIRWPSPLHIALILIGMPALLVLTHGIGEIVVRFVPSFQKDGSFMEDFIKATTKWPWWFAVLAIGVGPAIGEELFCRGFLGRGLTARYGYMGGVLITSFLFGLIHIEPPQAVMAALLGIVLHLSYLATRSLLAPMLIHFLNNTLAILSVSETGSLPVLNTLESAFNHSPVIFIGGSAMLVGAVGYALFETRAQLRAVNEDAPLWQPPCPAVALPPPGCGTVVASDPASPGSIALVAVTAMLFGLMWVFL